jgi:hypothetical protein
LEAASVDRVPGLVHGDFSAVSGEKITEDVTAVTEINTPFPVIHTRHVIC